VTIQLLPLRLFKNCQPRRAVVLQPLAVRRIRLELGEVLALSNAHNYGVLGRPAQGMMNLPPASWYASSRRKISSWWFQASKRQ